jgi:hypothetical protein
MSTEWTAIKSGLIPMTNIRLISNFCIPKCPNTTYLLTESTIWIRRDSFLASSPNQNVSFLRQSRTAKRFERLFKMALVSL